MATSAKWEQVGRDQFEAERRAGRWIWISDGVHGYTKPLVGTTPDQAVLDFEMAGEPASEVRVYVDGEWAE